MGTSLEGSLDMKTEEWIALGTTEKERASRDVADKLDKEIEAMQRGLHDKEGTGPQWDEHVEVLHEAIKEKKEKAREARLLADGELSKRTAMAEAMSAPVQEKGEDKDRMEDEEEKK